MTQVSRPLPSTTGADPILDDLIEAFAAKLQTGDRIDPEAYAQEHPERGEELRRILPAMLVLADLAQSSGHLLPTGNSRGDDADTALGELGDFRILREIGRGGMGVVYEAEQISLGRRVALKVLPFAAALDTKQLQRFKNEAQAAAHLHHTNIVPVHAVGCERGMHFYAMQYIEGQTLAQVIQELRELTGHGAAAAAGVSRPEGPSGRETPAAAEAATVPCLAGATLHSSNDPAFFRTVAQLGVQAAEALEHAHQLGIVHRDIKPANLLLDVRGHLWITDFGLAHCQSQAGLTMTGDLVGTLRYMSPEQALGKRLLIDHRTDIYSLGVTLYELLMLEPAFSSSDRQELLQQVAFEEPLPPRKRNKAVPRELETIVLKAIDKSPEGRYATAQELADDLRRYLEDKPIRAKQPTLWQRTAKWARRHKTVVGAAVLLLIIATIGLGVSTFLIMQQRDVAQANFQRAEQILDTAYRNLDKLYLAWAEKRLHQAKKVTQEDRQFLEDVLAVFTDFANQNSSAPTGRQKTAEAYLRVATIQAQLGQDAEAKQNYHQALEALRRLVAEFPNDADYRGSLARCLSKMAFMSAEAASGVLVEYHPFYFDTIEENQEAFREAIKLQERLIAEDPTREDYQWDLAESYKRLGTHLLDYYGRDDEAEKLFHSASTICTRLAEEHPTVLIYQRDLCDLLGKLGEVSMNTRRSLEAERLFRESLDRRKKLVDDFPGLPYPRDCLGWGYQDLAIFQYKTHRREDAVESFGQAANIRAKLAADFPGVRLYQVNLAGSYVWQALVWYEMDRVQEMEQAYEKALAVWEVLARDYPAILDYAIERSAIQTRLGELVMDRGQSEAALALHDQAIAAMRKLLAGQPKHVRALFMLQEALGRRTNTLLALGRLKELEQTYKDLEQHYQQAIAVDPSDHWNWFCDAPLRLQQGDIVGYARVCREMLARFSQTHDPAIAERTAKTCLLRPDAVSDLGPVRQLADRAITGTEQSNFYRCFLLCRAMADYRAGEFTSAIARLTENLSLADDKRYGGGENHDPALAGTIYVFLAMAHHRLGHADQAGRALDQATQVIDQMDRKTGPHTTRWGNWLRFLVVYREAEQLVRSQAEALK